MSNYGWTGFWKDQRDAFTSIMQINTSYFAEQLKRAFPLTEKTKILDYGCGPGLLIDSLQTTAANFTGVDINPFFVEQCKANHPSFEFFEISVDTASTEKIFQSHIGAQQYDVIVLLSILQYFKDTDEIERTLHLLKGYLKPSGKIILADIVSDNTSPIRDTWSLLIQSIVRWKIAAFIRFVLYLIFSPYRKLSDQHKLLVLPESKVMVIAGKVGMKAKVIHGMTIHATRMNYVLTLG